MIIPTAIVWWADNAVKNWRNLTISYPKPDLHNINADTKLPLTFIQVIVRQQKFRWMDI